MFHSGRVNAFAILSVGSLIGAVGSFAGLRLLTTQLAANQFGELSLLLSLIVFITNVIAVPVASGLLQVYSTSGHVSRNRLRREWCLATDIACSAALFVFAVVTLLNIVQECRGGWLFGASLMIISADVGKAGFVSFANAEERHFLFVVINIVDVWSRPLTAYAALVLWRSDPLVALAAYAGCAAVIAIGLRFVFRASIADRRSALSMEMRQVLRVAVPLVPMAITGWISAVSDRYILAATCGLASAGIFSAGYSLVSRPMLVFSNSVLNARRPALYRALVSDEQVARHESRQMLTVVVCGGGAICLVVAMLSNVLVAFLLGPAFSAAASTLPWLAVGHVLLSVSYVYNTVSLGLSKPHYALCSEAVGACSSVLSVFVLSLIWGIQGAAIAAPLYYCAQALTARYLAIRAGGLREWELGGQ